ncbi:Polyferredoxin [Alkalispirochaeta americana]|uniref:Polyferredoxin n=1 Tax=Alkalispirochaeta americana TaxID=159291 RepID=A0A1N6QSD4_9SPIO|nr:4Fe-4S binding protein [Alkalispirochaeta americana]SIQ19503.1 Polyferredoxin [Alkalispirochaeta americana]
MNKPGRSMYRVLPQTALLVLVVAGATLRNRGFHTPLIPELPGLCPLGAVQALASLDWSRLAVPAGVILTALLAGPVFCGRLCPLGTLQEWAGRLGKRIFGKPLAPSPAQDTTLSRIRFAVLLLVILVSAPIPGVAGGFFSFDLDMINPSPAFIHLWTQAVPLSAVMILFTLLAVSIRTERPWCRWLCPYGALLGFIGKASPVKIRRVNESCLHCKKCDHSCPMGLTPSLVEAVRDGRCNRCEQCIPACPVQNTLSMATPPRTALFSKMRKPLSGPYQGRPGKEISGWSLTAVAVLLFFTPLLATGIIGTLRDSAATPLAGAPLSARDISPTMTLQELSEQAGKDSAELLELLRLPLELDTSLMLIDLEDEPGLEEITLGYIRAIFTDTSREPHSTTTAPGDTLK